ncbi:MAG TPA: M23 family metallopeptidase, partial [Chitinophagaceae bacterium]|nr:M23 family metallopeptidase [Chitinophagaceae bacterium]
HIGIRPQSWGRYIIINHPNGYTTLYGHLNDFFPELETFVRAEQYKQESWAIELDFTDDQFKVEKGQFIAYSGNTGGSQGPHLHFELRETKTQKCLNPLLFGFAYEDDVPPNIVKLALFDRSISSYDQFPKIFPVKSTDSGYIIPKLPVLLTGIRRPAFAIQAYDRSTGSKNPNGIFSAKLFLDDVLKTGFILDSINYDESTLIHAQIDYRYHYNGGAFLQNLSPLPGDPLVVYPAELNEGQIELTDTFLHHVRIEIGDVYHNRSRLDFMIRYSDSLANMISNKGSYPTYAPKFIPNQVNHFISTDFEATLPDHAIFDTITQVYFKTRSASPFSVSAAHQLNDPSWPLEKDLVVRIKPDKEIPEAWKNKLVMQRNYRGSYSLRKARWDGDWLTGQFGDFGIFQVFADLVAPEINDPGKPGKGDTIDLSPATRIMFQPRDNFGSTINFRAELDGQWLRFTNDKGRTWIYEFDERCPYGIHELKVKVEDLVGNVIERSWWIRKYPYTPPKKKAKKKASGKKQAGSGKKKIKKDK